MTTVHPQYKTSTAHLMNWTSYDPLALKLGRFFLAFSFLERNLRFTVASKSDKDLSKMNFAELLTILKDILPNDILKELYNIKDIRNRFAHGRFGACGQSTNYFAININGADGSAKRYTLSDLDGFIDNAIRLSNLVTIK